MLKFLFNPDKLNATDRMFSEIFHFIPGKISIPKECSSENPIIVMHNDLRHFSDHCDVPKVVFVTDLIRLELLVKKRGIIGFVTTSELQSRILRHVLDVPTFTAEEPLDTLYSDHSCNPSRSTDCKNICFFGYSNSIERTCSHLSSPLNAVSASSPNDIRLHLFSDKVPPSFRCSKLFRFYQFNRLPSFAKHSFGYVVLSDVPVDLSVATLAKSPNKLLSSFQLGLLPIVPEGSYLASRLPSNYPYKFDSVTQLLISVEKNLRPEKDIVYFDDVKPTIISNHLSSYVDNQLALADFLKSLDISQRVKHQERWPNRSFYSIRDSWYGFKNAVQVRFFN
jgi:hypothetical protein